MNSDDSIEQQEMEDSLIVLETDYIITNHLTAAECAAIDYLAATEKLANLPRDELAHILTMEILAELDPQIPKEESPEEQRRRLARERIEEVEMLFAMSETPTSKWRMNRKDSTAKMKEFQNRMKVFDQVTEVPRPSERHAGE